MSFQRAKVPSEPRTTFEWRVTQLSLILIANIMTRAQVEVVCSLCQTSLTTPSLHFELTKHQQSFPKPSHVLFTPELYQIQMFGVCEALWGRGGGKRVP